MPEAKFNERLWFEWIVTLKTGSAKDNDNNKSLKNIQTILENEIAKIGQSSNRKLTVNWYKSKDSKAAFIIRGTDTVAMGSLTTPPRPPQPPIIPNPNFHIVDQTLKSSRSTPAALSMALSGFQKVNINEIQF